jgi:membrane protease YdiL (CAAX protease family)
MLAHIVPFAVFMALLELPKFFKIENEELPWHTFAPEQWIYPVQTVIVALLLAFFWRRYCFAPIRGCRLASVLAVVGIACWILPSFIYQWLGVAAWPEYRISIPMVVDDAPVWELLGLGTRMEGFDPSFFEEHAFWYWSAVVMRFVRMVIVVALVEEIFWRGFLQRCLADAHKPFSEVPFGSHSWKAYFGTTLAFTIVHAHIDWLACLVYGSLTYWLSVRTKSLFACVCMHGIANLLLGIYTLQTRQWGFW